MPASQAASLPCMVCCYTSFTKWLLLCGLFCTHCMLVTVEACLECYIASLCAWCTCPGMQRSTKVQCCVHCAAFCLHFHICVLEPYVIMRPGHSRHQCMLQAPRPLTRSSASSLMHGSCRVCTVPPRNQGESLQPLAKVSFQDKATLHSEQHSEQHISACFSRSIQLLMHCKNNLSSMVNHVRCQQVGGPD